MTGAQKPPDCLAFTRTYGTLVNRIITDVHLSIAFQPKNQPADVQFFKTPALWDTGATHSVITDATAKALGLRPTGKRIVQHGGGQGEHNTHLLNFYLPNQVAIAGVLVTEHPQNDGQFGAIIGMDIIAGGDMSITNHGGKTCFTFRYPSYGTIDYVAEFNQAKVESNPKFKPVPGLTDAEKAKVPQVGRNDMCPCGSGRKYKKCHGAA